MLAIAGYDPSGGAGVIADARIAAVLGVHCVAAVTAVTDQDSRGVYAVEPVGREMLARQLKTLADDFSISAVKVGMLATEGHARSVAAWIEGEAGGRAARLPVVVDPVLEASDGAALLDDGAGREALAMLLRWARVVTPNIVEAERLSGVPLGGGAADRRLEAAAWFLSRGAASVLLKGGHRDGDPEDWALGGGLDRRWRWRRQAETPHGTGCATSTAIAANLALGMDTESAIDAALNLVQERIREAVQVGRGRPFML